MEDKKTDVYPSEQPSENKGAVQDDVIDEQIFLEEFGLPPEVKKYSQMGDAWKKQIPLMTTEEIIKNYDSNDYCEEYMYYCYVT